MTAPNGVIRYWDQNSLFLVKGGKRKFKIVVQAGGEDEGGRMV